MAHSCYPLSASPSPGDMDKTGPPRKGLYGRFRDVLGILNANKEAVALAAAYTAYIIVLRRVPRNTEEHNMYVHTLEREWRGEGQNDALHDIKQHCNPRYLRDLKAGKLTPGQTRRLMRRLERITHGDGAYAMLPELPPTEHDWLTSVELGTDADHLDLLGSEELANLRPDRPGARYRRFHDL